MPVPARPGQTCCEAVQALLGALDRATPKMKLAGPASSWTWSLEADGVSLAVSGRAYLRQRECQYSVGLFLLTTPSAVFSGAHCRLPAGPVVEEPSR